MDAETRKYISASNAVDDLFVDLIRDLEVMVGEVESGVTTEFLALTRSALQSSDRLIVLDAQAHLLMFLPGLIGRLVEGGEQ